MSSIIREIAADERQRSFLLPTRILRTTGRVEQAETLLDAHPLQIHIGETGTARLDNRGAAEKAGILLDFGRELHGGVRLLGASAEGCAYPMVRLRFGESAAEAMTPLGVKGAGNDHAVRDFTVPVPAMSDQEWGMTGFRFVYIELQDPEAVLTLRSVLAVYVRRELPQRGSFRCSDARLNEIFDVAAYTCRLCMQGRLWDGIKRDRLVWIGDSHPEMLAIRSLFGEQKLLEDSLDDICAYTPLPGWMNGMPAYSMWWLCILRDWYAYTGRRDYPDRHRVYVQGLVDQLLGCIDADGRLCLEDFFLDWPSRGTTAARDGVQGLAVLALRAGLELLALWPEDGRCGRVQAALDRLVRYPGRGDGSKPAAALLYLAGMLSPQETAQRIGEGGARGFSTFMSYYLLTALARTGGTAAALETLRTYYGGMLEMGATTFWEDFSLDWMPGACPIDRLPAPGETDIHGDFGAFCYEKFRHSLCHGWSSGPVPFLLETVLGIAFEEPGGRQIRLHPSLGDLDWAEGTYPLPGGGELFVRCCRTSDGTQTTFSAPTGIHVTVDHTA